jgi:hypothetical protein
MMLLVVAAMGWLAAPATARADRVLAAVERPTAIRAWDGIGAFSVYDSGAGVYRLAVTGLEGPAELVAVAPRVVPFDADVGPDAAMRPTILYSRCARERPRRDCDIYRYSLARGVESKVSGADSDAASGVQPVDLARPGGVGAHDRRAADGDAAHLRPLADRTARGALAAAVADCRQAVRIAGRVRPQRR